MHRRSAVIFLRSFQSTSRAAHTLDCARKWRRSAIAASCAAGLAVAVLSGLAPAIAAGLTLRCGRADTFNPVWNTPITFQYEGADRGTLRVSGALGDFSMPGSRVKIPAGEAGEAIDAVATARLKLPALADLEACIDKAPGAKSATDSDAYLNARDACLKKLPAAASGVDAVAQIRLGFDGTSSGGEDAFVVFRIRYEAPSRAPGGKMQVEAFPAQCALKK